MITADVVVVGDGVAGCAAAVSSCRLGLATVMVRCAASTRTVDLPETLAPLAVSLLRRLGIGAETIHDAFPAVTTRISCWGKGHVAERAMLPPANASLLLGKPRLRTMLLRQVLDAGIPTINATGIDEIRQESGRILVRMGTDGIPATITVSAGFAIDATGRVAAVAQRLGVRRRILDTLVSFWISGGTDGWPQRAIAVATAPDGWLFCAGSNAEQAAIGFFTAGSRLRDRPTAGSILARAAAIPAVADLIRSFPSWKASPVVTKNAATTSLAASGGENWIACGDALQTVDPIASSGTYLALKQATLAASVAKQTLAGDRQALWSYEVATRREFREILAQRNAYYGLFRTASGAGGGGDAAA